MTYFTGKSNKFSLYSGFCTLEGPQAVFTHYIVFMF
jgi:hypothetical protein